MCLYEDRKTAGYLIFNFDYKVLTTYTYSQLIPSLSLPCFSGKYQGDMPIKISAHPFPSNFTPRVGLSESAQSGTHSQILGIFKISRDHVDDAIALFTSLDDCRTVRKGCGVMAYRIVKDICKSKFCEPWYTRVLISSCRCLEEAMARTGQMFHGSVKQISKLAT